jgi:hypothetical protein
VDVLEGVELDAAVGAGVDAGAAASVLAGASFFSLLVDSDVDSLLFGA